MWKPGNPLRPAWAALTALLLATAGYGQQPARTTVSDTVYRADGSAASGTLLISWPAFTTADAKPVAAGTLSVAIGTGGAVSVALAPNAGANPDGTFYKVVFKLDDGTTEREITQVSSTTTTIDGGQGVPAGYGIEVRRTDSGWGPDNDRNLVGRFATQGFVVPRLAKRQDYFLRLFDASVPPQYSRHSALLHIDYPF